MFLCMHVCTLGEVRGHCPVLATFLLETGSFADPGFNLLADSSTDWLAVSPGLLSLPPQRWYFKCVPLYLAFFEGAGDQIQALMLAKQTCYCLSHFLRPMCLFEAGSCYVGPHELTMLSPRYPTC